MKYDVRLVIELQLPDPRPEVQSAWIRGYSVRLRQTGPNFIAPTGEDRHYAVAFQIESGSFVAPPGGQTELEFAIEQAMHWALCAQPRWSVNTPEQLGMWSGVVFEVVEIHAAPLVSEPRDRSETDASPSR